MTDNDLSLWMLILIAVALSVGIVFVEKDLSKTIQALEDRITEIEERL